MFILTPFRSITIRAIDRAIVEHLQLNGRIDDEIGEELIWNLVSEALRDGDIRRLAKDASLSKKRLIRLFQAMVEETMPNPLIVLEKPALAATLPFLLPEDFSRLQVVVLTASSLAGTGNDSEFERRAHRLVGMYARHIIEQNRCHSPMHPLVINPAGKGRKDAFTQSSTSCLSAIILTILVGLLLVIFVIKVIRLLL